MRRRQMISVPHTVAHTFRPRHETTTANDTLNDERELVKTFVRTDEFGFLFIPRSLSTLPIHRYVCDNAILHLANQYAIHDVDVSVVTPCVIRSIE